MKEYKLFSLSDDNNYSDRFNKIINKYKNGINGNDNNETINYYYDKNDKERDTNINNMKNKTNINSFANLNFNSKPLSSTRFNLANNTDSSPVKYKTLSKMNVINNIPNYNNFNDDIN